MSLLKTVGGLFGPVSELVDSLHTSTEEKMELKIKLTKVENQLTMKVLDNEKAALEAKASIIAKEAESKHTITATWRPITMLVLVAVVVCHMLGLMPFLYGLAGVPYVPLSEKIVAEFFLLVQIGIGGYVGSRGIEKVAKSYVEGKNKLVDKVL